MPDTDRYSRQVLVKQVGLSGQKKLSTSRVLIVGLGGLGCQVSAQLAGAGVGSLSLIDNDAVDLSNLHRQILFRESDIGESKVLTAQRELIAINSSLQISATQAKLSTNNVTALVKRVDLVIDAADNFLTSYLLSDECFKQRIPLLTASVNRSFGYLGVFCGDTKNPAPSLRALFPKLPKEQLSCDTVGVTGPSVGVIASLQAQEALKVLLDDQHQLLGELLYVDLWDYKMHRVNFNSASEPSQTQAKIIDYTQIIKNDLVIDVRNPDEIANSPQPFATNLEIPLIELSDHLAELQNAARVVLACKSGQRALIAAQILLDEGYDSVAVILPSD